MNSKTLVILKSLYQLLSVFMIIAFTFCDGKRTQEDLQNAVTMGQTLRNTRGSTPQNNAKYPQGHNAEATYTVRKHTCKSGETLQDLAILYHTDEQIILQANCIEDLKELKPGQTILIPIKKSEPQQKSLP